MKLCRAIAAVLLLPAGCAWLFAQAPGSQIKEPVFDPLRAEKSIEVGLYYMKKGNYDAAIERFRDAASARPNYARPYRLMGEAYEKKGDKAEAIKAYRKYLEIVPGATDAEKIRKRIAKLSREIERDARRRSR